MQQLRMGWMVNGLLRCIGISGARSGAEATKFDYGKRLDPRTRTFSTQRAFFASWPEL